MYASPHSLPCSLFLTAMLSHAPWPQFESHAIKRDRSLEIYAAAFLDAQLQVVATQTLDAKSTSSSNLVGLFGASALDGSVRFIERLLNGERKYLDGASRKLLYENLWDLYA